MVFQICCNWHKNFISLFYTQIPKSHPDALRNDALEKAKKAAEIQARIQATMMSAGLGGLKLPNMPGLPPLLAAAPKAPAAPAEPKPPPAILTK